MRFAELRAGQPLLVHGKHRVHGVSTRVGTLAPPFKTTLLWAWRELPAFSGSAERNAINSPA